MEIDFDPPDASANFPGTPLQQSGTYAAVLRSFGCHSAVADIRSDGARLARARILVRGIGPLRLAWVPRGPVWAHGVARADQSRALAALPRAAPWCALWAMGGDAGGARRGLPVARGGNVAELDLTQGEQLRRSAQHGKWRNRLKRAETAGLSITAAPLELPRDAVLLARERAQRRARGYAALPHAFLERWQNIAPQDTLLLTAKDGGAPVAFMLFLLHTPTATYHLGWSGERGRATGAHGLLLWRASQELAARGYHRLDLGHADPQRTPGITRFKLGAGAAPRALGATTLCL
ncbi:hypothetical protein DC366_01520 [Pelagivirga sediminicola]|uniref:BioF2-like acetyltransferase domain-containing protein n=1 Tax=Pelagivirga sediminicola TaxID=2170575 RepID=A0A2T7GB65_9RHOB|nr:GNAT family N-acetyltransferase [Pelagivirga sediminicola]PVA11667.1 hypothetical protein DC366_01520 [Pelagivirga sediminicola]